jgi:Dehydratase family
VEIDADAGRLAVRLSAAELRRRLARWRPPAPRYTAGVFAKYAAQVASAADGAVTTGAGTPSTSRKAAPKSPRRKARRPGGRAVGVRGRRAR